MIKIKIKKQKDKEGAVVVILNDKNETLIMLRPADAHWAPRKWGYAGGKIDPGETSLEAATREVKEETTLDVYNLKPIYLGIATGVDAFYTRNYTGTVEIDFEHDDWAWVARANIENYDLAPQVLEMFEWVLNND